MSIEKPQVPMVHEGRLVRRLVDHAVVLIGDPKAVARNGDIHRRSKCCPHFIKPVDERHVLSRRCSQREETVNQSSTNKRKYLPTNQGICGYPKADDTNYSSTHYCGLMYPVYENEDHEQCEKKRQPQRATLTNDDARNRKYSDREHGNLRSSPRYI